MPVTLKRCAIAFIQAVLCSNPILKGSFVTLLNGLITQLDLEIAVLSAQLLRLNVLNSLIGFSNQALDAIISKVAADLNLILGPMQRAGGCLDVSKLQASLQNTAAGKNIVSARRKLNKLTKTTDLSRGIDALIKAKEREKERAQEFINQINTICP